MQMLWWESLQHVATSQSYHYHQMPWDLHLHQRQLAVDLHFHSSASKLHWPHSSSQLQTSQHQQLNYLYTTIVHHTLQSAENMQSFNKTWQVTAAAAAAAYHKTLSDKASEHILNDTSDLTSRSFTSTTVDTSAEDNKTWTTYRSNVNHHTASLTSIRSNCCSCYDISHILAPLIRQFGHVNKLTTNSRWNNKSEPVEQ